MDCAMSVRERLHFRNFNLLACVAEVNFQRDLNDFCFWCPRSVLSQERFYNVGAFYTGEFGVEALVFHGETFVVET
jgi:hypothetical protein